MFRFSVNLSVLDLALSGVKGLKVKNQIKENALF